MAGEFTPGQRVLWNMLRRKLVNQRHDLGLTQKQLSARMNRSEDFVAYLETHKRSTPTMATVFMWCDALGMTFDLVKDEE